MFIFTDNVNVFDLASVFKDNFSQLGGAISCQNCRLTLNGT